GEMGDYGPHVSHRISTALKPQTCELFCYLQKLAASYGRSFVMTSGDRTCSEQRRVSTENPSYHVNGRAFDAVVQPYDPEIQAILGRAAVALGFRWGGNFSTGEFSNDVVHFDDGLRFPAGWC